MGEELGRAREHVFLAGLDDSGARLCEANVPYGLAKIHHAQAPARFACRRQLRRCAGLHRYPESTALETGASAMAACTRGPGTSPSST